jgi:hypothetical protein
MTAARIFRRQLAVALSIVGRPGCDATLLAVAAALTME